MPLKIESAGLSDIGLVRKGNEDYLFIDKPNHVYAVCDGMGGHKAGEVASLLAADTLHTSFNHFSEQLLNAKGLTLDHVLPPSGDRLLRAVRLANRAIYNGALVDSEKQGMGTTIVAAAYEADIMCLAHVGDSRAYQLTENKLLPLTRDHSWLEELQRANGMDKKEASSFVGKNVITRALGVKENVEIDFRIIKIKPGDTFIFCSDGLCGFLDDDEIFNAISHLDGNLSSIASELVQAANDRGGADNVTVLALKIEEVDETSLPETEVFTLTAEDADLLHEEDSWVTRFADFREKIDEAPPEANGSSSENKPGGVGLWIIFVLFAIVAAAVIYFSNLGD